ncbi:MAG: hypothetical protein K0S28_567 [Paucimonas sp.]|jgi:hypothetical protein|nr:hypothetical protein [Paucimonas sp.]
MITSERSQLYERSKEKSLVKEVFFNLVMLLKYLLQTTCDIYASCLPLVREKCVLNAGLMTA